MSTIVLIASVATPIVTLIVTVGTLYWLGRRTQADERTSAIEDMEILAKRREATIEDYRADAARQKRFYEEDRIVQDQKIAAMVLEFNAKLAAISLVQDNVSKDYERRIGLLETENRELRANLTIALARIDDLETQLAAAHKSAGTQDTG